MQRRFGLLYTLFSILVLVVLAVLTVVRLNTVREFNIQEAETSFIRLQGRVRSMLADSEKDPQLGTLVREYAAQVPTIDAVVLYVPADGLRYVWSSDTGILAFGSSNLAEVRGTPTYQYSDVRQIKVTARLDGSGVEGLRMDGVYTVLGYSDAYAPLRDSLIALVAFALLTVLIAVAMNMSSTGSAAAVTPGRSRPATESATGPQQSVREPEPRSDEPRLGADHINDAPLSMPVPMLEEVDLEEIATDPGEPGTLFSPASGLSFQGHLEKRLSLELERAAYNDQDLTCMLLKFEDAAGGGEAYNQRARQVLAAFKFEDLCFEYGSDAFCVILPNTELSRGIREAESFKSDHKGKMYVGLSARNGRLVEATRVLGEAERSLEHANHEPGGIVGFKPDPRKYRQYVTRHLGAAE